MILVQTVIGLYALLVVSTFINRRAAQPRLAVEDKTTPRFDLIWSLLRPWSVLIYHYYFALGLYHGYKESRK